jgi:hypothetical protein
MKYWKRINLEHEEEIRKKSLDLITKHSKILDPSQFKGSFIPMPPEFLKFNPAINRAFEPYGRVCTEASVYLMWNNLDAIPHIDYQEAVARVNIPLLNCEGSSTIFYDNVQTKTLLLPTGAPYHAVTNTDYREVDRVEINSPTILRISAPHSVIMNQVRVPRLTLTLMLSPDIGDLLDPD